MFRSIMNTSILDKAKEIIKIRREKAEKIASDNKEKALAFPQFKSLYSKYMTVIIDNAKNGLASSVESKKLEKDLHDFLKSHKIGSITPIYFCDKCNDTGLVDGKKCICLIKEINEILKNESNFGHLESFDNTSTEIFDNKIVMKEIYKKMENWCHSNFKRNLILISGNTGVGKTYLTKCMANELIKLNYLVLFTSSFKLHQDFLKSHACTDFEEKTNILDKYLTVDILFIDDLGSENRIAKITDGYLYQIINERKVMNKPTIITTNLDGYEIKNTYSERISSRIFNRENSYCLQISNSDLRLKK